MISSPSFDYLKTDLYFCDSQVKHLQVAQYNVMSSVSQVQGLPPLTNYNSNPADNAAVILMILSEVLGKI